MSKEIRLAAAIVVAVAVWAVIGGIAGAMIWWAVDGTIWRAIMLGAVAASLQGIGTGIRAVLGDDQ